MCAGHDADGRFDALTRSLTPENQMRISSAEYESYHDEPLSRQTRFLAGLMLGGLVSMK
jgi:hypothetical protein